MTSVASIIKGNIKKGLFGPKLGLHKIPTLLRSDDYDKLLYMLCNEAIQGNNKRAMRDIIAYFNEERASIDPIPTLTFLANNKYIKKDFLKKISDCFPEKNFLLHMYDIIPMSEKIELSLPIAKIWESILPPASFEDWKLIKEYSDEVHEEEMGIQNKPLCDWILEKYKEAKKNKCPDWVSLVPTMPLLQPIPFDLLPSTKEATKIITKNLKSHFISYEENDLGVDANEYIETIYGISTIPEKITMVYNKESFFDDADYFHTYGPLNNSYTNFFSNSFCDCTGGCRMLSCSCFLTENNDEDLEYQDSDINGEADITDWYLGYCEDCKEDFVDITHALREPLIGGSWLGCLCMDCLEIRIGTDPKKIILFAKMKEQLESIKIYRKVA